MWWKFETLKCHKICLWFKTIWKEFRGKKGQKINSKFFSSIVAFSSRFFCQCIHCWSRIFLRHQSAIQFYPPLVSSSLSFVHSSLLSLILCRRLAWSLLFDPPLVRLSATEATITHHFNSSLLSNDIATIGPLRLGVPIFCWHTFLVWEFFSLSGNFLS